MFITRLISGILLLIVAIATMAFGNIWLILPLYGISLVAYRELTKALKCSEEKKFNALDVVGMLGITFFYLVVWIVTIEGMHAFLLLGCVLVVFMALMLVYVVNFPKFHANQVLASFFAFVYAPVMLSFVFMTREAYDRGIYLVWLILISSWGSDTCAYAVGVLIGKHKIFPRLSPKKSLEGCIGGVLGTALIGGLYAYFLIDKEVSTIAVFAVISAVGAVMSMIGDLAASAIKRNNEIKDYGKLIPGHGGIMDRFDSMIVTAPMTYFMLFCAYELFHFGFHL